MTPEEAQKRREVIRLIIKRMPELTVDDIGSIVDPLDTVTQMEEFMTWLTTAENPRFMNTLMTSLEIAGIF